MSGAAVPAQIRTTRETRGALWPVSLAGALLLHLAGSGALLWLGSPSRPSPAFEPPVIELMLERLPAEAPDNAPEEAPAAEAPPAHPEPEPAPPESEPPSPPAPAPAPAPAALPQAVAPPPRPPPRPRPPRNSPGTPAPSAAPPQAVPTAPAPAVSSNPPVVTHARFRRTPAPPDYPLVARERGITGIALIRALVGTDGETKELRLHRSSGHEILDRAALAAVRRWAFEPSSLNGQRMEAWIEVPIRFQLR